MDYSQQAAEWASQHKCPGCGGEMAYDGTNDCLRCKQCGNTVAVDASLGEVFEYAYSHPETAFNLQWGQQKVSLRCKNCGASGEYDVLAAADFCPFCGGSVVLCGEDPPGRRHPLQNGGGGYLLPPAELVQNQEDGAGQI